MDDQIIIVNSPEAIFDLNLSFGKSQLYIVCLRHVVDEYMMCQLVSCADTRQRQFGVPLYMYIGAKWALHPFVSVDKWHRFQDTPRLPKNFKCLICDRVHMGCM